MTTSWFMALGIDVEHLPRSWWVEGEDDCPPDGLAEDEQWSLIRRAALAPHRAIALTAECVGTSADVATVSILDPLRSTPSGEEASFAMTPDGALPTVSPLLLTIKEAAERLGVGRCIVQQLVLDGSIRSFKIGTKLRRIPPEALDEYIERSLGA